ncbi:type II toxin-antitoxin system RelE/ParE family toxin [Pirellulimonas nuda]|uniref:type II toxin-antitoxin system RelE/ParE family toxin n=1 Tax=Pirellulimonas nuda TaxID=2528009 RepID=UPI0018D474D8|nr:type II toxin-antitoxin system RelE/ParE family toxin [Pirellulimonas nuda]
MLIYRDEDDVPLATWFRELNARNRPAAAKCIALIGLLESFGSELRRPRADYLSDGVYELRTEVRGVNYRILYGFVGKNVALLSHGLTKEGKIKAKEIDLAVARLERVRNDPDRFTASVEELR